MVEDVNERVAKEVENVMRVILHPEQVIDRARLFALGTINEKEKI